MDAEGLVVLYLFLVPVGIGIACCIQCHYSQRRAIYLANMLQQQQYQQQPQQIHHTHQLVHPQQQGPTGRV